MIKCFICFQRFGNIAQYNTYCATCPKLGARDCARFSNVSEAFGENREKYSQYLFPIVGPAESGKSYYLHTLTRNLVENINDPMLRTLLTQLDIHIDALHGYDLDDIFQLRETLGKDQLKLTDKSAGENNIPIVLSYSSGRGREMKYGDLCFFDLSGEHFHDKSDFMKTDARIVEASGIFVFIDPFRDLGLNSKLSDTWRSDAPIANEASNLVRNLVRIMRRGIRPKSNIPIVFCLTMFDLYDVPNQILQNMYVPTEKLINNNRRFNTKLIDTFSTTIEEFVKENTRIDVALIEKSFKNYKWFAISTIGHSEIENNKQIDPKGIYAPMLWLLYKNHLIS